MSLLERGTVATNQEGMHHTAALPERDATLLAVTSLSGSHIVPRLTAGVGLRRRRGQPVADHTIAQRLGEVNAPDRVGAVEIGERAGDLEDAMVAAGR